MSLRRYKTNRGIWLIAALGVFIAVGLGMRFDIKGETYSLVRLIFANVSELLAGHGDAAAVVGIPVALAIWGVVALAVGWILQSIVVIAITRYGKSKPSA